MRFFLLTFFFFLASCTPKNIFTAVDTPKQIIRIHLTSSTEAWMPQIYDCADRSQIGLVARTPNIAEADISIRLDEQEKTNIPAYKIGETELVVVGNASNSLEALSKEEVEAIFAGKIRNWAEIGGEDAEIQLWGYGQENELQAAFNEILFETGKISTLARQAQNPGEMREEIAKDANAVGIISGDYLGNNIQILYSIKKLPVLAIPQQEAQGAILSLLSCLQEE